MARAVTRGAIERPRMIIGVTLMLAGHMFLRTLGGDSNVDPAPTLFGLALAAIAELTAGELGPGFRTRAEVVVVGPAAQQIGDAVRKTKKKR